MSDQLVWVPCKPCLDRTPSSPFHGVTHIGFQAGQASVSSWSYREGYVKRLPDGRPTRVLLRTLSDPECVSSLDILSYFDPGNVPPRVISPHGVFSTPTGLTLVAPWLNGISVETIQKRLRLLGTRLPPLLALEAAIQVLEILAQLGPRGNPRNQEVWFTHGALRPSTIHVGVDGSVHLVDVGPETVLKSRTVRSKEPAASFCLPYLAPEQLSENGKETPQTDLYSVAVVIYELIAGKPLFNGSVARRELEIRAGFGVQEKVEALAELMPGLPALLAKALSVDPQERFESAREMGAALAALRGPSRAPQLAGVVQDLMAFRPSVRQREQALRDAGARAVSSRSSQPGRRPAPPGASGNVPAKIAPAHPTSRRSHIIVGLIGLAVAAGAYFLVATPGSHSESARTNLDRAVQVYQPSKEAAAPPSALHSGAGPR